MKETDMRYIIAIAEEGSIQKAANKLKKNTSSLGRCIKRVEEDMNIVLFQRTPVGLIPTPEGECYINAAFDILQLLKKLESPLEDSNKFSC